MNFVRILNNVQVYFYVRKSTVKGKPGSLHVRITANGRPVVCSVPQIAMFPKDFDKKSQSVKMSYVHHQKANDFIAFVRGLILDTALNAEKSRRITTAKDLRAIIAQHFAPKQAAPTFVQVYHAMMEGQKAVIGKEISQSTYAIRVRYLNCITKVLDSLGLTEVPINELEVHHMESVRAGLLSAHAVGYAGRILTSVTATMVYAKKKGIISFNPMTETESIPIDKSPDLFWLEPDQLQALIEKDLSATPRAEMVRDAFVFCCFTGLAIGDYELLNPARRNYLLKSARSPKDIEPGRIEESRAGRYLIGRRRKTGTMYRVPLLPEAEAILSRYGGVEKLPYKLYAVGNLLNLICADLNLRKTIRFHHARKTFANYLINVRQINTHLVPEIMGWVRYEEVIPYTRVSAETLQDQLK